MFIRRQNAVWVCSQLKVGLFSFFRLKTVVHFVPIRSMLKMRVPPTRNFILITLRWWKWLQGKEVHPSNLCKFNRHHLIIPSPQMAWKLFWMVLTTKIILHSVQAAGLFFCSWSPSLCPGLVLWEHLHISCGWVSFYSLHTFVLCD